MARRPRAAAQLAAANLRTPTPLVPDASDEEMLDAPVSDNATPLEDGEDPGDGEGEAEDGEAEEGDATPARDSEPVSRSNTPRSGRTSALPRKRRLGRPPKNKPTDWDQAEDNQDAASDTATPRRRGGRGRGGWGRWGKLKGGPSHTTQVPIDKEGNMMDVIDDEVALPEDAEGEKKVDKMGNLQGGREYRVRIFTILGRGDRQYMLSTEPARCIGFRDSYLFFQKHKLLYKIIIDEEAKKDLIERDLIPHSYKGRAIGVVTARSVFREFGAKIIIGGRKILDDYNVQEAKSRGDVEGELAVPEDRLPGAGEAYNRNQYVAWHGASAVYHSTGSSVPMPPGKAIEGKKRKIMVTSDNWMLEHAREASRFNNQLAAVRQTNLDGLYDVLTNSIQYPSHIQPTHSRWEQLSGRDEEDDSHEPLTNGYVDDDRETRREESVTRFPPLPPIYFRNFRIHDLVLEGAPETFPRDAGLQLDQDNFGISSLSMIPDEVVEELPPECRTAFDAALSREAGWKSKWLAETVDGCRGGFVPSTEWCP